MIRNSQDVINQTQSVASRSNLYNMARIIQANAYMILTDSYGEIPYSDAEKGYTNQIFLPKYDTQQAVYAGIIKELTEATAALDATKATESADVLYTGNIALWKK